MLMCRGVRGATTVPHDTEEAIMEATMELLNAVIDANGIEEDDVASVIFTTTPDLTAAYPAKAARLVGWVSTALMGCQEMDNPNGSPRTIRLLVHWNTVKPKRELKHVYLRDAALLRPDLTPLESVETNLASKDLASKNLANKNLGQEN